MASVVEPIVLLISHTLDYSTDHIAHRLADVGVPFLRLNRDQFADSQISLSPDIPSLCGEVKGLRFNVKTDVLKSIYFRAPVFLRDNCQPGITEDEQLARSQWAAFLRALTVFRDASWMNHPKCIYQAEVKAYQLLAARSCGLAVPKTLITNDNASITSDVFSDKIAIKVVDTTVLRMGDEEAFIYTQIMDRNDVKRASLDSAPVIVQDALLPKLDIRVTVVGGTCFASEIVGPNGQGVDWDWRLQREPVEHRRHQLPACVERQCTKLVSSLELQFAGIDLIRRGEQYYFVELNPTGEWAWLVKSTGYEIDEAIASLLSLRGRV